MSSRTSFLEEADRAFWSFNKVFKENVLSVPGQARMSIFFERSRLGSRVWCINAQMLAIAGFLENLLNRTSIEAVSPSGKVSSPSEHILS